MGSPEILQFSVCLLTSLIFFFFLFYSFDQAVAFGGRFIRLGGPVRAEHVSKYRRLQQIEEELEQRGILASREQHVFPVINVVQGEDGGDEEK